MVTQPIDLPRRSEVEHVLHPVRSKEAAMPVPKPRDPDATREVLTGWLGDPARLPGAEITQLETPEFNGFSSETLMVDVNNGDKLAVRVAPVNYQVFPDVRFKEQYLLMRILAERTDIPVPPIRWYEPDAKYLGAPFFVMARIEGRVPTDMPPYHSGGWVTEIEPAERAAMWWSALEILARLHRLDVAALDVGFLDQPEWGATGLAQRLGYYEHYMYWAYQGPKPTRKKRWTGSSATSRPNEIRRSCSGATRGSGT
jgi:aminoglycoside phosphotransferase (APT) family kinase protein